MPDGELAVTPASTAVAHSHGEDRAHGTPGQLQPGPHLKVTERREPSPKDLERAGLFIQQARQSLEKYQDYHVAFQEGYRVFAPEVPQVEYHFINPRAALMNINSKDPTRPTALLYKKVGDGYQWVGAMYSAPLETPEEALDEFFPLGVTQWHAHINICVPREIRGWESLVNDSQFGLEGSIDRKEECDAAGGRFLPDLFGWMAHIDLSEAQ